MKSIIVINLFVMENPLFSFSIWSPKAKFVILHSFRRVVRLFRVRGVFQHSLDQSVLLNQNKRL